MYFMLVRFEVVFGIFHVLFEYGCRVYKSIVLIEFIYVILQHAYLIALELGEAEALGEEVVHGVVCPPREILQALAEPYFGSEQVIIAEVVHHLEVLQLEILVVKKCSVFICVVENAVPLNSELQMENGRIEVAVLVPPSLKQRLFEAPVLGANKDFCLFVQTMFFSVKSPLGRILDFNSIRALLCGLHAYFLLVVFFVSWLQGA